MGSMRPLAKGYILTMFGLGGTVLLWSLSSMPTDRVNWSVFAILAVLRRHRSALSCRHSQEPDLRAHADLRLQRDPPPSSFGPGSAGCTGFLPEWIKGKKAWYIQLFNIANVLVDANPTSAVSGFHKIPFVSFPGRWWALNGHW